MGKPTGFKEYTREDLPKEPVYVRIKHWRDFEKPLPEEKAYIQAARCMDCGIPFCQGETGCPVENLIPEFNDYVYNGLWKEAIENLHSTNNFPEFTGKLCPAPCESACVLGLIDKPVSIKAIEYTIIDRAYKEGWVRAQPPLKETGKKVAIVGSGPAGLACAQQLRRKGHQVFIYEREPYPGGLLRYGIPDFKMEKWWINRRVAQLEEEGVRFYTGVEVGKEISLEKLTKEYDAVILAIGAEEPRDFVVPGRDAKGIYYAMTYLVSQNRYIAGEYLPHYISAKGKKVLVIGGGDTAADCIGTANRQGAERILQFDYNMPPPRIRSEEMPWPFVPKILYPSPSHEEGCERKWMIRIKEFLKDKRGNLTGVKAIRCLKKTRTDIKEIPGSEEIYEVDMVFLAIGFSGPRKNALLEEFLSLGGELDKKGNLYAKEYQTTIPGVFTCGDSRVGASLIVIAIYEGRECAKKVDAYLQKKS